jgi:hypothetical protein
MPRKKPINPRTEWGDWNKKLSREADTIFTPHPKMSDNKVKGMSGIKTEATPSKSKWDNTIKHYAKIYEISTINDRGIPKGVNQLSNEIYAYEKLNKPKDAFYPFLEIKGVRK